MTVVGMLEPSPSGALPGASSYIVPLQVPDAGAALPSMDQTVPASAPSTCSGPVIAPSAAQAEDLFSLTLQPGSSAPSFSRKLSMVPVTPLLLSAAMAPKLATSSASAVK